MRAARVLLAGLALLAAVAFVPPSSAPDRLGRWQRAQHSVIAKLGAFQTTHGAVAPDARSFAQHLRTQLHEQPALAALQPVLCSVAEACRDISRLVRHSAVGGESAERSVAVNVQGELQSEMDVEANRLLKAALCRSGHVAIVASEEDAVPSRCGGGRREFAAVIDPLDGSANVAAGLPTGTIFGVYRRPLGPPPPLAAAASTGSAPPTRFDAAPSGVNGGGRGDGGADEATVLQRGSELVAAGYCLYSAATQLVVTVRGHGAHLFSLDDAAGDFFVSGPPLRLPADGPLFCFNDAYSPRWEPAVAAFAHDLKHQALGASLQPAATRASPRKVSARYVGALVADVHNVLRHGGIFGYPATRQTDGSLSRGKLRLVYEANPLAMVVRAAGGAASDGRGAILDKAVREVHERTPLFIGSASLVAAVEEYVRHFAAS